MSEKTVRLPVLNRLTRLNGREIMTISKETFRPNQPQTLGFLLPEKFGRRIQTRLGPISDQQGHTQDQENRLADEVKIGNEAGVVEETSMTPSERPRYRFGMRLLLKHPNFQQEEITRAVGLEPSGGHTIGQNRQTPDGTALAGQYRESAWTYSEKFEGMRDFFQASETLIDELQPVSEFLAGLQAEGGTAMLVFSLPGDVNIGSILPYKLIKKLANLHLDLGIEVFPKMR